MGEVLHVHKQDPSFVQNEMSDETLSCFSLAFRVFVLRLHLSLPSLTSSRSATSKTRRYGTLFLELRARHSFRSTRSIWREWLCSRAEPPFAELPLPPLAGGDKTHVGFDEEEDTTPQDDEGPEVRQEEEAAPRRGRGVA